MGLIDNLLAAFRSVGQDYKRLAAKVDALPEPVQDTGWRDVTGILRLSSDLRGTRVYVRRVGDICYAQFVPPYSPKRVERRLSGGTLPSGFHPLFSAASTIYGMTSASPLLLGAYELSTSGHVLGAISTQHTGSTLTDGVVTYATNQPFPSELPGTPAGF